MADNTEETEVNTDNTVETTTPAVPAFEVPEEYKETGWAKNIKSNEDLWKSYANAQSLIGKKSIPDFDTADDKAIQEYYSRVRPKEATDYDLGDVLLDNEAEQVRKTFYDNGLNKKQAKAVLDQFVDIVKADATAKYGTESFKTEMESAFGQDWEAKTKNITNFMKSALSQKDFEAVGENMTNASIKTLYQLADKMMSTYGAKDSDIAVRQAGGIGGRMDFKSFYEKMKEADNRPDGYQMKKDLMKQFYGE